MFQDQQRELIFGKMAIIGPEKLSLALRYLIVEAAILQLLSMYHLGGGEYRITIVQLRFQGSTRSSLHPPASYFSETAVVIDLDLFQSNANRLKSIDHQSSDYE